MKSTHPGTQRIMLFFQPDEQKKPSVLSSSDKKKTELKKRRRPVRKHALQRRVAVKSFTLGDIRVEEVRVAGKGARPSASATT